MNVLGSQRHPTALLHASGLASKIKQHRKKKTLKKSRPLFRTSPCNRQGPRAQAEAEAEEITIDIPGPEHILIFDDAFSLPPSSSSLVTDLRAHFDQRFADPLKTTSDRFVWDYWHVPGQYTLLRTPANSFFPLELYDRLEDSLIEWGERVLGCRGISPVWLSYYIDGCRQELHTDAPHGPWAFVLSLTDWDARSFTGGETVLLSPRTLEYWRNFDPGLGMEVPQLTTTVEPRFARLTVFDPRLPHGVRAVEGPRDPRQGRIVLHGWFASPTPFFSGALTEEVATPALNATLEPLYKALAELAPAVGTATVRITVGGVSGRACCTTALEFLTNTVIMRPQGCTDPDEARMEVLGCICDHLFAAQWPKADGRTIITLPFIFE